MRPERPLEPMRNESNTNLKGMNAKVKKRVKLPPLRARRRLIDPTKWDSAYLKGVFLDAVPLPSLTSRDISEITGQTKHDIVHEEDREAGQSETSISEGEIEGSFRMIVRNSHEGEMEEEEVRDKDVEMEALGPPAMQTTDPAPSTKLKALFAPREDGMLAIYPVISILKNVLCSQHPFLSWNTLTLTLNLTLIFLELMPLAVRYRRITNHQNRSYLMWYRFLPHQQLQKLALQ